MLEDQERKGVLQVARIEVYINRGTIGMWIRGILGRTGMDVRGLVFSAETCFILPTNLG